MEPRAKELILQNQELKDLWERLDTVRGEVLSLREREFVEAARALGATGPRIVLRNILPNAIAPILVALTLGVVNNIVAEATLAIFGYGPKKGAGSTSLGCPRLRPT